MTRGGGGTFSTYVSIDISDVLAELSDKDLREECEARKLAIGTNEFFEELRSLLYRRDIHGALMLIERHNEPKDRIENAYHKWLAERVSA